MARCQYPPRVLQGFPRPRGLIDRPISAGHLVPPCTPAGAPVTVIEPAAGGRLGGRPRPGRQIVIYLFIYLSIYILLFSLPPAVGQRHCILLFDNDSVATPCASFGPSMGTLRIASEPPGLPSPRAPEPTVTATDTPVWAGAPAAPEAGRGPAADVLIAPLIIYMSPFT